MSPADHGLALDAGSQDPVVLLALAAANANPAEPGVRLTIGDQTACPR
jgi:hypothetical protein